MADWHEMTALAVGREIEAGRADPVDVTEHFLARIDADPDRNTIFITVTPDRARAEAAAAKDRAARSLRASPLDGVPITWKDLFDTGGTRTTSATRLLENRVPAHDCPLVARGARAGIICLGKTNLSELAFSGLGVNPVTGTPPNAYSGAEPLAPGGSSSGAAVSVAKGLATAGIGSDTGGSVRIPASWNGLVGLKTTWGALPDEGTVPLAPSLDTPGPLTRDVADAAALWSVFSRSTPVALDGASVAGRRFFVPTSIVWDKADPEVAAAVEAAIDRLAAAGADIVRGPSPVLEELFADLAAAPYVMTNECYGTWKAELDAEPDKIFHQILERFRLGHDTPGPDFVAASQKVRAFRPRFYAEIAGFDGVLMPTVAITPPPVAALEADDALYKESNMMALRNTRLGNFLGICALTLPCGRTAAGLPVGLMIVDQPFSERRLLRTAAGIEQHLAS